MLIRSVWANTRNLFPSPHSRHPDCVYDLPALKNAVGEQVAYWCSVPEFGHGLKFATGERHNAGCGGGIWDKVQ